MHEENQCCEREVLTRRQLVGRSLHQVVGRMNRWVFLNVWCSHLYRPTMRMLHHFNLHYAPPAPMSPRYGWHDHWCQWCGLRGKTYEPDLSKPLEPLPPNTAVSGGLPAAGKTYTGRAGCA